MSEILIHTYKEDLDFSKKKGTGCVFTRAYRLIEPRHEKTGLRGFRPGPTQTSLYSHRRWLEA